MSYIYRRTALGCWEKFIVRNIGTRSNFEGTNKIFREYGKKMQLLKESEKIGADDQWLDDTKVRWITKYCENRVGKLDKVFHSFGRASDTHQSDNGETIFGIELNTGLFQKVSITESNRTLPATACERYWDCWRELCCFIEFILSVTSCSPKNLVYI